MRLDLVLLERLVARLADEEDHGDEERDEDEEECGYDDKVGGAREVKTAS